jgi:transcriptional regulator with XRE-family HTH domain
MVVGNACRAARKRRGLSQEEVAAALGVSDRYVRRIESGERHPSVPTLDKLRTVLQVSADELLGATTASDDPPETGRIIRRVREMSSPARKVIDQIVNEFTSRVKKGEP